MACETCWARLRRRKDVPAIEAIHALHQRRQQTGRAFWVAGTVGRYCQSLDRRSKPWITPNSSDIQLLGLTPRSDSRPRATLLGTGIRMGIEDRCSSCAPCFAGEHPREK